MAAFFLWVGIYTWSDTIAVAVCLSVISQNRIIFDRIYQRDCFLSDLSYLLAVRQIKSISWLCLRPLRIMAALCLCSCPALAAKFSTAVPPAFLQLGIVADNFEWPVTSQPEIEIQTKVDHIAALTSASDGATNSHRWIRVHLRSTQPGPALKNVIAIIRRANLRGMKVLVNVIQHQEDFDEGSDYIADLAGTPLESHRRASRFSQTSPEKFRARMERMLAAFRDQKLRVDAFEISNELDWGAFNGNLVNGDGTAPSLAVMQQSIGRYAEIFKIAHRLIRNDATFKHAKLITFGFANPDRGYLTRPRADGGLGIDPKCLPVIPAEVFFGELQGRSYSFNGQVQQPRSKENVLRKFADGVGLHVYADDPGAVVKNFAEIVRLSGKPLWITEWGYLKNGVQQKDDTRRNKMNEFIRQANEFNDPRVETLFYYSYNDNWGLVAPMKSTSDPSVTGAVFDSACKVFKDYTH